MWLVDELHRNLPQELDFLTEKSNSDRLRGLLGLTRPSTDPFESIGQPVLSGARFSGSVIVPRVLRGTSRVLVMEFVDGFPANDRWEGRGGGR